MNIRALIAEFVGTFALILGGTMACGIAKLADSGLVAVALAHGLILGVMISATAAVSGGHLNPAVTFGLAIRKVIDLPNAAAYIVAQLIGGAAGAAVASSLAPKDVVDPIANGAATLHQGLSMGQGIAIETIATFFLVYAVLGTAVDAKAPKMGGLFIGLVVAADILWCGPLTGAAMNVARWFGPAVVGGKWDNAVVWIVGPLLGGALAALVYGKGSEAEAAPA